MVFLHDFVALELRGLISMWVEKGLEMQENEPSSYDRPEA